MIRKKTVSFLLLILGAYVLGFSQNKNIDVLHYRFELSVNDRNDTLKGKATIRFNPLVNADQVYFDLIAKNKGSDKGMEVIEVKEKENNLDFEQKDDKLYVFPTEDFKTNQSHELTVVYQGIPEDGLIIASNRFGKRTFFSDNWPNRARYWIPVNDHPSDKATVEFLIRAPHPYQIIANGFKVEESFVSEEERLTHWKQEKPIPTKVMAIGIAEFAVQNQGEVDGVPISHWVFSDNRKEGFDQYAPSTEILPFFTDYLSEFPYNKLAHVQSKTRFGGMENASNIFYSEKSIKMDSVEAAKNAIELEALIAHEIAHQWFGNEASESDWPHLWLSEGFATYLTNLYLEKKYGKTFLQKRMIDQRNEIIAFHKQSQLPVVNKEAHKDLLAMLNPNSYQKGGWILHMLRRKLGDSIFQKGLQAYYEKYKGDNASTDDFRKVMEAISDEKLTDFFTQWLDRTGHPELKGHWSYDSNTEKLVVDLEQIQEDTFQFPLEIKIVMGDGKTKYETVDFKKKHLQHEISITEKPKSITLDPGVNLLFDLKGFSAK